MRRRVIRELGDPITIREGDPGPGKLGFCDERTLEIVVAEGQPEVGKAIVLVHELLHLVDAALRKRKVTRRRIDHAWITAAAPNLLALLVLGGFWRGVSKEEVLAFLRDELGGPRRRRRAA